MARIQHKTPLEREEVYLPRQLKPRGYRLARTFRTIDLSRVRKVLDFLLNGKDRLIVSKPFINDDDDDDDDEDDKDYN